MNTFHVGDRVRVVKPVIGSWMEGHDLRPGDLHTVTKLTFIEEGRPAVWLRGMPSSLQGWHTCRFVLAGSVDCWDPSTHNALKSDWFGRNPGDWHGDAALAVLTLINIVQHMQPRWVERPPDTVMVELPRKTVDFYADLFVHSIDGGLPASVVADACRATRTETP